MSLSPQEWHARFNIQAQWTQPLRRYLLPRAGLDHASRILDVGCGTGALLAELDQHLSIQIHGLDLDRAFLTQALCNSPRSHYTLADAHTMPYADNTFDLTLCHFLLLWVRNPYLVLKEMRRVTRQGGALLALAEPDYSGRVDYPDELAELGELQLTSLRSQGADPEIGRRVADLFSSLYLDDVEVGVLGAEWIMPPSPAELESEWTIIHYDLSEMLPFEKIEQFRRLDEQAWRDRRRVMFVPTFYAWGRLPA